MMAMMVDDPKILEGETEPTTHAIVSTTVKSGLILTSVWYQSEVCSSEVNCDCDGWLDEDEDDG